MNTITKPNRHSTAASATANDWRNKTRLLWLVAMTLLVGLTTLVAAVTNLTIAGLVLFISLTLIALVATLFPHNE
jgi:hypothetical protein